MKKISVFFITLALLSGALPWPSFAADRAGNGGDFNEMQFVSLGYEDLGALQSLRKAGRLEPKVDVAAFADKLKRLRVEFVERARLSERRRSAVNYPSENLIQVDQELWSQHPERMERLSLVLHEMLWLVGVNDEAYRVSAPLFKKMEPHLQAITSENSATPVLLYSFDEPDEAYDAESASAECALQKEQYENDYFFVYCVYFEKNWNRIVYEAFDDASEIYLSQANGETYYERRDDWHTLPISREERVYGLRVFGMGKLETLPWKVVGSSLGLGGQIDRTFGSARQAERACRSRMRETDLTSLQFYQARCRTVEKEKGVFYYEIVTQNPLASAKQ